MKKILVVVCIVVTVSVSAFHLSVAANSYPIDPHNPSSYHQLSSRSIQVDIGSLFYALVILIVFIGALSLFSLKLFIDFYGILAYLFYRYFSGVLGLLSEEEKKSFELIKSAQAFGRTYLGLKRTRNFIRFRRKYEPYNRTIYHEKTKIPFSLCDSDMFIARSCSQSTLNGSMPFGLEREAASNRYDFDDSGCLAAFPGAVITQRLLELEPEKVAFVAIHEDLHGNMNLPWHMEEAFNTLAGHAVACQFLKLDIQGRLKKKLAWANIINCCHEQLSLLASRYAKKEIDFSTYQEEKDGIVARAREQLVEFDTEFKDIGVTGICGCHAYTHYFPLMYKLFYALGADLNRFIKVCQDIAIQRPKWNGNNKEHFRLTRDYEKQIEAWLEKVIQDAEQKQ